MIKNNQSKLNFLHILSDAVVTLISYLLAYYLVIGTKLGIANTPGTLPFRVYMWGLIVIIPLNVLIYAVCKLYTPKRIQSLRKEFFNILKANIAGLMVITFALFAGRNHGSLGPYLRNFSTRMIVTFVLINVVLSTAFRSALRITLRKMRAKGFNQKHVLLVGFSDAATGFIERNIDNPQWGYSIMGIIDDELNEGDSVEGVPILGDLSVLRSILAENKLDEIIVTLPLRKYEYLKPVVNICEKSGVHTMFVPDYQNIIPTTPYTEDLEGLPIVHIRHVPLTDPFNAFIKRCIDIIGSIFAIILFSPIMLVTLILVKLTSEGPIIYAQERVGMHNRNFNMYKFRSMYVQRPEEELSRWTTKQDPRVTSIGRIIRKLNIDEMPQFFNVLKGDMSLVGPRPERPQFVEKFREEIPRYMIKHQVRPGITGWAQVNGLRGDTSIRQRIDFDLWYIENWTLSLDFKILFMTVFKGFKNAY